MKMVFIKSLSLAGARRFAWLVCLAFALMFTGVTPSNAMPSSASPYCTQTANVIEKQAFMSGQTALPDRDGTQNFDRDCCCCLTCVTIATNKQNPLHLYPISARTELPGDGYTYARDGQIGPFRPPRI